MNKLFFYLSVLVFSLQHPGLLAVEATGEAKKMLSELAIRESKNPVKTEAGWRKPTRIILLSPLVGPELAAEILAGLRSAADGAELIIAGDIGEVREKLNSADVLLGNCTDVVPEMKQLKWVQHFSAGVERCMGSTDSMSSSVLLTNMKGVFGPGIAEHVIAMMFSLSRGLHQFQRQQADAKWNRELARIYPMQELKGKTLLVVGLGGIGSEIAWRAHALGMRVIATRNSIREKPGFVDRVGLADELPVLAAEADIIVNATPLTPSTTGLFDKSFFQLLKPSAYFINVGRGRSVVTDDLVAALETGKLAGAALDVVDPEPLPENHVLWKMPNVIITPHMSGRSDQVMQRFWIFVRENLRRYVQGEPMLNVVNRDRGY